MIRIQINNMSDYLDKAAMKLFLDWVRGGYSFPYDYYADNCRYLCKSGTYVDAMTGLCYHINTSDCGAYVEITNPCVMS